MIFLIFFNSFYNKIEIWRKEVYYMKNKTNQDIKNALAEQFDEEILDTIVLIDTEAYARAVIGITEDYRLIYDYDSMVEGLMEMNKLSEQDAIDHIEYNTIRSLPYIENAPIIKYNLIEL